MGGYCGTGILGGEGKGKEKGFRWEGMVVKVLISTCFPMVLRLVEVFSCLLACDNETKKRLLLVFAVACRVL